MILVAITGRMGAGKSTLANLLCAEAARRLHRSRLLSFADPIRDVAQVVFGGRFMTQEEKAATLPFWRDRCGPDWATGRQILQRLGTDVFRQHVHEDIWVHAMEARLAAMARGLDAGDLVAIGDCRFANEAALIRRLGGTVVRIVRADHGPLPADAHASERGFPLETGDVDLLSTGLAQLREHARDLGRRLWPVAPTAAA